jgi:GMP synthase-like glutamine amidotransferase
MTHILIFQHLSIQGPGVFKELWDAKGYKQTVVLMSAGEAIPRFDQFDMLAVMGGPMDVWEEAKYPWLVVEKAAIRHWVQVLRKPFLGVCLGHQLLADALGGKVTMMDTPEVGLTTIQLTAEGLKDPILAGLPSPFETLQWHSAAVSTLPEGAVSLASNKACPNQVIRWGERAYGFQNNTEITPQLFRDWIEVPEYRASLEMSLGTEKAAELESLVLPRLPKFREAANRIDNNFAKFWSGVAA